MKERTYRVKVYCRNCDWHGTQDIPKGISVDVLSSTECPICGCEEMKSLGIPKETPLTNSHWTN